MATTSTSTSNLKQISRPVQTGTNYEFWSIKMKTILHLNKCWDMVEIEFKEPDTNALAAMNNSYKNALEACRDRNLTSKWLINSCTKESIFPWISGATDAHQAWNLLALAYKETDRVKTVRLQTLRLQFESLKMKESETVDQFMTRVSGIVAQFQTYGEPLEQKIIVQKILRCLTKKFAMVVTAIEEAKDLSKFTLEELTGSLLPHEFAIHSRSIIIDQCIQHPSFSQQRLRQRRTR